MRAVKSKPRNRTISVRPGARHVRSSGASSRVLAFVARWAESRLCSVDFAVVPFGQYDAIVAALLES